MSANLSASLARPWFSADSALRTSARCWFIVAVAGQWLFVAYLLLFYVGTALGGHFEAWNKVLPRGHVAGDTAGNIAIAVHIFLAILITLGGQLQLVPQVRAKAPALHRWSGRVYLSAVVIAAISGLYMVWIRGGGAGDTTQHLGISLDAVLILAFAGLALREALARRIQSHRRWALRLFMVVSGVWFFRVGLMLWIVANQGPAGFDPKTFTGPFLSFLSFADYLIPLAVLEIYLRTKERGTASAKAAVAGGLFVLTLAMGAGSAAAGMIMWIPRM